MSQKITASFPFYFLILILCITCRPEKKYAEAENNPKKKLVRDEHSYANIQRVRVKHLDLQLNILWKEHILKGSAALDLDIVSPCDTLILDSKQLSIAGVFSPKGKKLTHWLGKEDPLFGSPLYVLLQKNKKIIIRYETHPEAAALQWLSPEQTHDKSFPFL